jgi:hypothetical protein
MEMVNDSPCHYWDSRFGLIHFVCEGKLFEKGGGSAAFLSAGVGPTEIAKTV